MNRNYSDGMSENVSFFIGQEIEKTPAFGLKTLFVVGLHRIKTIQEQLDVHTVEHIFFGANHSFGCYNSADNLERWENMIVPFLKEGYMCTLDIPLTVTETFNDSMLCEYNNFIPQIRVPLPYIKLWNYNTMLKIDDKGFNATNPGVWCHSLHNLLDRDKFTNWSEYRDDKIIS